MNEELEQSSGNVYRDLGYEDPEEALARADLMLDIVEAIHREDLDLEQALTRLQIDQDRYFDLLGGRVRRFTQQELRGFLVRMQAGPEDNAYWLHLPGHLVGALRDWLADSIAQASPPAEVFAPAYRGNARADGSIKQTGKTQPRAPSPPPTVEKLDEPRFRWLPILVRQEDDGLSLVLQRRKLEATVEETPPRVSVFIEGEPSAILSRDYATQIGRLELLLAGELPAPDFHLAISPSDGGDLTVKIRAV